MAWRQWGWLAWATGTCCWRRAPTWSMPTLDDVALAALIEGPACRSGGRWPAPAAHRWPAGIELVYDGWWPARGLRALSPRSATATS